MFIRFMPLVAINKRNGKQLIKTLFIFTLFRLYPKLIAFFINLLPTFSKKHVFLRADCDHFGSWMHVFLAYAFLQSQNKNVQIYICAKKGTIDKGWLKHIEKLPIKIIYKSLVQFLIAPFFHSKYALDVNGHIVFANNSSLLRSINRIPIFTEKRIYEYSTFLKENLFTNKILDNNISISKPYVLFYARSGRWIHSIRNSKRNMPKDLATSILENIVSQGFKVILIGDTSKEYIFNSENISHIGEYKSENLDIIYSNAVAARGSGSGAIHFPSFIFNLPTLTFTCKPFFHLDAMYMPPSNAKPFTQHIPLKDKWVMAGDMSCVNLIKDVPKLISYFLSNQNLKNLNDKLTNPFKYIYTNVNSRQNRFISTSDNANIIIY